MVNIAEFQCSSSNAHNIFQLSRPFRFTALFIIFALNALCAIIFMYRFIWCCALALWIYSYPPSVSMSLLEEVLDFVWSLSFSLPAPLFCVLWYEWRTKTAASCVSFAKIHYHSDAGHIFELFFHALMYRNCEMIFIFRATIEFPIVL